MKIDLAKIDLERFHVNSRTIPGLGDFALVVPHKAMWQWNNGEYHLRSLLCRDDGTVVSSGFGKFFNHGEKPQLDMLVTQGLKDGTVSFTEKVDGSLIIRSVIDGRVHFRTRGSELIATDMREEVERTIRDRYPALLDPTAGVIMTPEGPYPSSLLMEYVSPANQIVVRYDEPRLFMLGISVFGGDALRIVPAGSGPGLPEPVQRLSLPSDIRELASVVRGYDDREGIVTWTMLPDGSMHLTKFKSSWYLRLHSLRSQATPRYLREFCYVNGISTLEQLQKAFMNEGFDWEVVSYIEPMFDEQQQFWRVVEHQRCEADALIACSGVLQLPSRKDIALRARELFGDSVWFGYTMKLAQGDDQGAQEIVDAMRLDMSSAQIRNLKKNGLEKPGEGKEVDDG